MAGVLSISFTLKNPRENSPRALISHASKSDWTQLGVKI